MPGQIKIDDGAGNYTVLTNGGSLGSDKTITIPNETATLATTNGITVADVWRLTANISNTDAVVSSNWERADDASFNYLGTGMTESSGIFTFPSTGIWQVLAHASQTTRSLGDNNCNIEVTTNNSTYDIVIRMDGDNSNGSDANWVSSGSTLVDVTDTSNVKVRMYIQQSGSTAILMGNTGYNRTSITFIRLGDT